MAAAEKKPSRKELLKEPDRFITFTGKTIAFGRRHRRLLTYAAAALACLLVVFTVVRYQVARAENTAFTLLDRCTARYQAELETGNSPAAALEAVREDFEGLLATYGNREGGKLARFSYARICARAGRLDEAVGLYERSLADFGEGSFYGALILHGLGWAHAEKRDWEQAVACLTKVLAIPEAPLRDKALFVLAGIHDLRGRSEEAAAAYRRLRTEFGDSVYAPVARERIAG